MGSSAQTFSVASEARVYKVLSANFVLKMHH